MVPGDGRLGDGHVDVGGGVGGGGQDAAAVSPGGVVVDGGEIHRDVDREGVREVWAAMPPPSCMAKLPLTEL